MSLVRARAILSAFAASIALLLFLGCRAKPQASSGAATRIVSLSPSTTEAIFVIGGGQSLVGRSRYCDWPAEVTRLPQVGGYVDPSYEAILALRPDLVVGARGPAGAAITQRLEARGVATYFPKAESFAEIDTMILGIGERLGRTAAARAYVDGLDARVSAVESAVAGLPRARVLLVFGLEPLSVAGPSSFADEMIRRAGAINVVTEGGAYPTLGVEHVLALDPDLVVNAAMAEERAKDRLRADAPGWSRVRAVAQGHVVSITDESVLRPGPRIADGLLRLAKAIHPDARLAEGDGGGTP
jgi:cobalamin transport system substrate-binding protein